MPHFTANRRHVPFLPTIQYLFAAPILSLSGRASKSTILFHPKYGTSEAAGTIIDRATAIVLGIDVGSQITLSLYDVKTKNCHDFFVRIRKVIDSFAGEPVKNLILVAATELQSEFDFSDKDPLQSELQITLGARDTTKCYPEPPFHAMANSGGQP